MRQAPALASWLLEHFVVQETLAGDLAEEYARGRSRAWYSKQVFLAIFLGGFSDIREHKLLALRAVVLGGTFAAVWASLDLRFVQPTVESWRHGSLYVLIPIAGYFGSGWVVGRFHRPPLVFAYLAALLIGSVLRYFRLTPDWLPGALQPRGWWAAGAAVAISLSVLLSTLVMRHARANWIDGGGQRPRVSD